MPINTELTQEQRAKLAQEGESLRQADELLTQVEQEAASVRLPESPPVPRSANVVDIKERLAKPDATVQIDQAPVIDPARQKEIATDLITPGVSIEQVAKKLGSPYLMSAFLEQQLPGADDEIKDKKDSGLAKVA